MNTLSSTQLKENEQRKKELISLISSGEAFLMVGAGSSKIQGYPLWKELISLLEERALRHDALFETRKSEADEPDIEYSDKLVAYLGLKFGDAINDIYGEKRGHDKCHVSLVSLPFKGILTTNYDWVLESALRTIHPLADKFEIIIDAHYNGREVFKFLRSINAGADRVPKVVHIHGEYIHTDSIVLSAKHYEDRYGIVIDRKVKEGDSKRIVDVKWPLHRKLMWAMMATRRLVYVGFSMTDEYFRIMHGIVSEDVRFYGTSTHFLISRLDEAENPEEAFKRARFFKDEYGIETVFYPDDNTFQGLQKFIFQLEEELRPPEIVAPVVQIPNAKEDVKITEKLFQLSRKNIENAD